MRKKIIITGGLGFIGYNLCCFLLRNYDILIVDSFLKNDDSLLRESRYNKLLQVKRSLSQEGISFFMIDICDQEKLFSFFQENEADALIHLAAIPGVRDSFSRSSLYLENNVIGLNNVLKACSDNNIKNLVFSSSSSVYGHMSPSKNEPNPCSFYGKTKLMGEELCKSYAKSCDMNILALRLFTVYGPYARNDMAFANFYNKIMKGERINLNNQGNPKRAFTFVEDVVRAIHHGISLMFDGNLLSYNCYDFGNPESESVKNFAKSIANCLNKELYVNNTSLNSEESRNTYSSSNDFVNSFISEFDFTTLKAGVEKSVDWFLRNESLYGQNISVNSTLRKK